MGLRNPVARFFLPALLLVVASPFCMTRLAVEAQSTAIDLNGNIIDPLQANKGEAVVLIFVRTDCPISNRYAPTVQRLADIYKGKAAFWLVYPDPKESAQAIREHDDEYGYKIPAIRDPQRALVKLSQAQITPEAAVFDPSAKLIYHGRIDNLYADFGHARKAATTHELQDAIKAATSGKTMAVSSAPAVGCYISDLE